MKARKIVAALLAGGGFLFVSGGALAQQNNDQCVRLIFNNAAAAGICVPACNAVKAKFNGQWSNDRNFPPVAACIKAKKGESICGCIVQASAPTTATTRAATTTTRAATTTTRAATTTTRAATTTTTVKSTTTTTKAVAAAASACSLAKPKLISALSKPVQDLLAQKLTDDITPTSDVNLAIHAIAYYGDTATLTVLLDACANPNFVDGGGLTPLFMLYAGEDGSGDGKNVEATARLLLKKGANVNFATKTGFTALKQLDQTAKLWKTDTKFTASIAVTRKILTDAGAK